MIFHSPHPEVSIPDTPLTPFVFEHAQKFGDKPALIDATTGQTYTYTQLEETVRRAAAGLAARGYRKGDVLAILSPNVPDYAVAFHGASLLGCVLTTVN